jgi:glutamine synthetase
VSGADANPYLVLAAILSAALDGIERKSEPVAPVKGDAYSVFDEDRALPNTWEGAITALENSELMHGLLGKQFIRVFTAAKRQEQASIASQISDVEYQSYLGIL